MSRRFHVPVLDNFRVINSRERSDAMQLSLSWDLGLRTARCRGEEVLDFSYSNVLLRLSSSIGNTFDRVWIKVQLGALIHSNWFQYLHKKKPGVTIHFFCPFYWSFSLLNNATGYCFIWKVYQMILINNQLSASKRRIHRIFRTFRDRISNWVS